MVIINNLHTQKVYQIANLLRKLHDFDIFIMFHIDKIIAIMYHSDINLNHCTFRLNRSSPMETQKKRRGERGKGRAQKKSQISSRALAYSILSTIGGIPKPRARVLAGYASGYRPEKSNAYRSLQDRIDAACDTVGVSVEANAATLGEIAYNRGEGSSDRISAVRELNKMAGWQAPERVEGGSQTTNVLVLVNAAREQGMSVGEMIRQAKIDRQ